MANIFSVRANKLPLKILIVLAILGASAWGFVQYYGSAYYTRVGYQPTQPVAFQHTIHVEQLGLDCRYCHTYVDRASHSNVPATSTCMNCHSQVLPQSEALAVVRESWNTGEPIPWVRIHKAPDYVYFNHAVHVNRGISCADCHGQVQEMDEVYHAERLTMAWCLDCHRNPEQFIRPLDKVYDLDWSYPSEARQRQEGAQLVHDWRINPPQSCSGCHR